MKTVKRFFLSFVFVSSFLSSNVAHAGIPVIDAANLVNSIQQVLAWMQQYEQMMDQIQKAQAQLEQGQQAYNSITGIRGFGDLINNPYLKDVVPANVGETYTAINNGGFGSLSQAAKTIRNVRKIYNCEDRVGDAKKTCENLLNLNAQTQALQENALKQVTDRVDQIKGLQTQINNTQDPKAIAELQARLQVENAQVANDANRLAVMKAMAETQMQAAQQAAKERTLKMLAKDTPSAADTFVYQPPQ